jgi:hypothetical protein
VFLINGLEKMEDLMCLDQCVFTIHTNIEISEGSKDMLSKREVHVP